MKLNGVIFTQAYKKDEITKIKKLLKTAKLETIHGADHGFHANKKQEEQADKATVEFFLKNLFPRLHEYH